jgi:hypothetical protein
MKQELNMVSVGIAIAVLDILAFALGGWMLWGN